MEESPPRAGSETTCSVDVTGVAFALSLHFLGDHKTQSEGRLDPAGARGCVAEENRAGESAEEHDCSIEDVLLDLFDPGTDGDVAEAISDALYALARLGELCIERTQLRTLLQGPGGVGGAITSVDMGHDQDLASQYLQREIQKRLASASIRLKNSLKGSGNKTVH